MVRVRGEKVIGKIGGLPRKGVKYPNRRTEDNGYGLNLYNT